MDDREAMGRADEQVLEAVREAGSDLTKPHTIECVLIFHEEDLARECGRSLEAEGFHVEVARPPGTWWSRFIFEPPWTCVARVSVVPDSASIHRLSVRMREAASRFSGEYDGWGCRPIDAP